MDRKSRQQLIDYLTTFATESRWEKIQDVVSKRTRHLTVVVEDIYQPHNASAVLRSCDGFGIQDVHIIENKNTFDASSQVTIGADQWLSIHRYNNADSDNTTACLESLRKKGYKIIATSPHENDVNINDLPIQDTTALIFGTELEGISDKAKELADGFVKIPMWGFSESFNISVSAAICLYNLTRRLRNSDVQWELDAEEKEILTCDWLKRSIKAGELLEKNFLKELSP